MESAAHSPRTRHSHPSISPAPSESGPILDTMQPLLTEFDDSRTHLLRQQMAQVRPAERHLLLTQLLRSPTANQRAWEAMLTIALDSVPDEFLGPCLRDMAIEAAKRRPDDSALLSLILGAFSRVSDASKRIEHLKEVARVLIEMISPTHWLDPFAKTADGAGKHTVELAENMLSGIAASHMDQHESSRCFVELQKLAISNSPNKEKVIEFFRDALNSKKYANVDCWNSVIGAASFLTASGKGNLIKNICTRPSHLLHSEEGSRAWHAVLGLANQLNGPNQMRAIEHLIIRTNSLKTPVPEHWAALCKFTFTNTSASTEKFTALKLIVQHADDATRINHWPNLLKLMDTQKPEKISSLIYEFSRSASKNLPLLGWIDLIDRIKKLPHPKQIVHLANLMISLHSLGIFTSDIWLPIIDQIRLTQEDGPSMAMITLLQEHDEKKQKKIDNLILKIIDAASEHTPALLGFVGKWLARTNSAKPSFAIGWAKEMAASIGIKLHASQAFGNKPDIELWAAYLTMKHEQWRGVYREILRHVATQNTSPEKTSLNLDNIRRIKLYRDQIKGSMSVNHQAILSNFMSSKEITQTRFCTYPELEHACLMLHESTLKLKAAITQELKNQNIDPSFRVSLKKAQTACITLINHLLSSNTNIITEAVFNKIISRQSVIKEHIQKAVERALLHQENLLNQSPEFMALKSSFGTLLQITSASDFKIRNQNRGFYTIGLLDKNALSALFLGREVACCLAPNNDNFYAMLQRLIDPAWQPIVVRNSRGTPAAVAWAALCSDSAQPAPSALCLVIDFCDMKPRYAKPTTVGDTAVPNPLGEQLLEQLVNFVPTLATRLGLKSAWLGMQGYGPLKDFAAVSEANRTFEARPTLQIISAPHPFAGTEAYTDNLSQSTGRFCNLLPAHGRAETFRLPQ